MFLQHVLAEWKLQVVDELLGVKVAASLRLPGEPSSFFEEEFLWEVSLNSGYLQLLQCLAVQGAPGKSDFLRQTHGTFPASMSQRTSQCLVHKYPFQLAFHSPDGWNLTTG